MSDEKTEKPTAKKLKKVREQGQVTKSTDLVETACLAAVLMVLFAGERFLTASLREVLQIALDFTGGDHSVHQMTIALYAMGGHLLALLCGVALVAMVGALIALAPQTGLVIALEAVSPKLNAVSPGSGIQKIFSLSAVMDLLKMTVKAVVIVAVMWTTIKSVLPLVASALYQTLDQLTAVLWSVILKILGVAVVVYGLIGVVDYRLQAWLFIRKNRMSKDEVKREFKESDGNPEMKGERKRVAHEIANQAPKKDMRRANVLVVNPTHYAVALRYAPEEFPLPLVIAKGTDEQALLLRRYAAEENVPIVSNPPVARMLHKVDENAPIPEDLFEVVAAILRWVDSLAAQST
jgi:type III secretion protein U